jgi:hypothetical protein
MNQTQLSRLWMASGGCEMEALREAPFQGTDGVSVIIVHRSSILQTMTIERWSPMGPNGPDADTYVRRRDCDESDWGNWLACSGRDCA